MEEARTESRVVMRWEEVWALVRRARKSVDQLERDGDVLELDEKERAV